MTEKDFYRPDELAAAMNISKRTLYRMIKNRMIKAVRIGGQWRIPGEEYRKMIADSGK